MNEFFHLPTRRQFIVSASASALVAAHGSIAMNALGESLPLATNDTTPPRIQSLRLQTSAPLNKLKVFYRDVLELPVLNEESSEFTIGAGESRITFVPAPADVKDPFYHFAFNIPENKIRSALDWQRARGPVMNTPQRLRDPDYPDEVRHFRRWNAHCGHHVISRMMYRNV